MASKRSLPGKVPRLELLDIAETESDLAPDPEGSDAVDTVTRQPLDSFGGDLPALGELIFGQYQTAGGVWYVLDGKRRIWIIH